jgi:2-keto-3-deoxy-L-rhamnonate aldolase RhmA
MSDPAYAPDFRALLRSGGRLVGTWVTFSDPGIAEALAGSGVDFLAVDGEHGVVDVGTLGPILAAARASQIPMLFRVAENEQARIQHALDGGASGVIVPRIRSAADAARAVAATRYPPVGTRGIAPRRVSDYGRDVAAYLAGANDIITCCIQVETREALEDLDAILATPGIDALLVGPYDLSGALGHPGRLDHPGSVAAVADVRAQATAHGTAVGIHVPDVATARRRLAEGFDFVTVGGDYGHLVGAVDAMVAAVRA